MGKLYIFDGSALKTSKLREYLEAAPTNRIILSPPVCMELFKSDIQVASENELKILNEFFSQVVILKESYEIKRILGTTSKIAKRFIHSANTKRLQTALKKMLIGHILKMMH